MLPTLDFDEPRLVALISDPLTTIRRLHGGAACAEVSAESDPYFPEDGQSPSPEALSRCAMCPVAGECLVFAIINETGQDLRFGWWGGYGPDERADIATRIDVATKLAARRRSRPADVARRLRAQRRTIAAIAAELGCAERTIYRYLADEAA